jgi:hypothetical protein
LFKVLQNLYVYRLELGEIIDVEITSKDVLVLGMESSLLSEELTYFEDSCISWHFRLELLEYLLPLEIREVRAPPEQLHHKNGRFGKSVLLSCKVALTKIFSYDRQ